MSHLSIFFHLLNEISKGPVGPLSCFNGETSALADILVRDTDRW